MQSHHYENMLGMIQSSQLNLNQLIGRRLSLEDSISVLEGMGDFTGKGITVITSF